MRRLTATGVTLVIANACSGQELTRSSEFANSRGTGTGDSEIHVTTRVQTRVARAKKRRRSVPPTIDPPLK